MNTSEMTYSDPELIYKLTKENPLVNRSELLELWKSVPPGCNFVAYCPTVKRSYNFQKLEILQCRSRMNVKSWNSDKQDWVNATIWECHSKRVCLPIPDGVEEVSVVLDFIGFLPHSEIRKVVPEGATHIRKITSHDGVLEEVVPNVYFKIEGDSYFLLDNEKWIEHVGVSYCQCSDFIIEIIPLYK